MIWLPHILDLLWKILISWAIISLILIGFTTSSAKSHEAPSGWFYEKECCHSKDCAPVLRIIKEEVGETYVSEHGSVHVLPTDNVKRRASKDDNFHICMRDSYEHEKLRDSRTKMPICIYYPSLM